MEHRQTKLPWSRLRRRVEYIQEEVGDAAPGLRALNLSACYSDHGVNYIYDGNRVIQERDANNLPLVTYTRGKDLSGTLEGAGGIGGLLARTDHSTLNPQLSTAFYHCDGNGNVTCLINVSNIVVAHYLYDPYGNILSQSGPLAEANLYRFSSKEFHVASGLVYYLYRLYDGGLQRWLTRDPLGDGGFGLLGRRPYDETSDSLNPYLFVWNAPVILVDPNGLRNWQQNICQTACIGLTVLGSCAVAAACVGVSVITVGGATIPCTTAAAIAIGGLAAAGFACLQICRQQFPDPPPRTYGY